MSEIPVGWSAEQLWKFLKEVQNSRVKLFTERNQARRMARLYRKRWLTAAGTISQGNLPEGYEWLNEEY